MDYIRKKLKEHDARFDQHDKRFDQVDKRLDQHDKRFDQVDARFDQVDARFDQVDKRLDQLDAQVDFLVKKVLDHDERLERIEENMVTKKDHQQVMIILDEILGLTKKKDQELTMLAHGLQRLDDKFEAHMKDVKQRKLELGLI